MVLFYLAALSLKDNSHFYLYLLVKTNHMVNLSGRKTEKYNFYSG